MLELKKAIKRISSASSQKPNPNGGRPWKPEVLSDIESDAGGDAGGKFSEQEGTVDSGRLSFATLVAKARGGILQIPWRHRPVHCRIQEGIRKWSEDEEKLPWFFLVSLRLQGACKVPVPDLCWETTGCHVCREANRVATSWTPYDFVSGI